MKTEKKQFSIFIAYLAIISCGLSGCKKLVEQKDATIDVVVTSNFESSVLPEELQNLYAPSDIFTEKEQGVMFVPTGKLSRVDLKTPLEVMIKAEDDVIDKIQRQLKKPNEKDIQDKVKKYLSNVEITGLNSKETNDDNEKIKRIKEFIKQRQGENVNYAQILFYSGNPANALWENNNVCHDIDSLRLVLFESVNANPKSKFLIVYNPPMETSIKKPDNTDSTGIIPNPIIIPSPIRITETSETLSIGNTRSLNKFSADKKIVWTNTNPTVATVKNGTVTALSEGSATITATDGGNVVYKITVTVKGPVPVPVPIDLVYAVWTGKTKNGKPHDVQGTLRFKSQHLIDDRDPNKRIANAGDKVIGEFSNGHLVQGMWYKSDGNVESIIIGD